VILAWMMIVLGPRPGLIKEGDRVDGSQLVVRKSEFARRSRPLRRMASCTAFCAPLSPTGRAVVDSSP
jgi:hypothetical protein